jgi:hypothetical protein
MDHWKQNLQALLSVNAKFLYIIYSLHKENYITAEEKMKLKGNLALK